jgi:hypothetical protein
MRYAQRTEVSSEKSRAEIERMLLRYGASKFAYGIDESQALIGFQFKAKQIRFVLPLPSRSDKRFWHSHSGRRQRDQQEAYAQWEQACRQLWRALALNIKAKLEAVESGLESFEQSFLPYIVLRDGKTIGERLIPQLNEVVTTSRLSLPGLKEDAL